MKKSPKRKNAARSAAAKLNQPVRETAPEKPANTESPEQSESVPQEPETRLAPVQESPAAPSAQEAEKPAEAAAAAETAAVQTAAKAKKQRSPMTPVQLFLLNAVIIVTAVWLLFGFVFGLTTAPNADMSPNIKSGDLLLTYRLDREFRPQDVVTLRKNGTTYVGRIVARGGDTVEITDDSQLVINGNIMVETNIYTPTPRYEGYADEPDTTGEFVKYPVTLGEGEYFVLADHRSGGEDSRVYGKVTEKEMLGKVITVLRRSNL